MDSGKYHGKAGWVRKGFKSRELSLVKESQQYDFDSCYGEVCIPPRAMFGPKLELSVHPYGLYAVFINIIGPEQQIIATWMIA